MKFEELPPDARSAAIEVYKTIAIREAGLVDDEYQESQTVRLENLAESIARGFAKLCISASESEYGRVGASSDNR
ncbi:hypothetical protein [Xenorhabdus innexi]|uniref:Transcriptional regulator n=1 Tax=Xenorhabdus innexi TaxID=290109 RepID=A0A1N6MZ60_9GAMM|nr:hypothetical protein [Xenorhabdus innexi]PHM30029.1 transcriptional regulator [Xenorhabdus innexi]SIP74163.1 hypothetical protein XIS1_540006 [Xenorhabdus innexi]